MKKIYSFVAVMFTCFVGNVNAQSDWEQVGNVTADGIEEGKTYVLTGGDNTLAEIDETTGENKLGGNAKYTGKFITSSQKGLSETITDGCVFTFVKTGAMKEDTYPVYVLKNFANGKYLSGNFQYADNKAEAYQFTVRDAELKAEPENNKPVGSAEPAWSWAEYSNAASDTRSIRAEEIGAVILCLTNTPAYLTFSNGANPDNHGWIDTNNWLVYEVTGSEMSAEDKFVGIFDKYFTNYDEETYPVGDQPGCVSADFAQHIQEVYEKASNLLNNGSDEEYIKVGEEIVNLFEKEIPAAVIPVGPGYFVLKNVAGRGFLTVTDDGKKARGTRSLISKNVAENTTYEDWTPAQTTSWDLNSVKNIWQVVASKADGKLLFKNFGTGKYLTTGNGFAMAEEGSDFVSKNYSGKEFYLEFGNGGVLHMQGSGDHLMMDYRHPEDAGSRFVYYSIGQDVIDSMSVKVNQSALNDELKEALEVANNDYYGNQYLNYVPGDLYKDSVDAGLVESVLEANASAGASESKSDLSHLFDSDMETYYHTAWKAEEVPNVKGTNWIKVDLGKPVSKLVIKFTKRQKSANNHISQYKLYTSADGQKETEEWNKLVQQSADSIEFAYGNNTHIAEYDLKEPVRYLRFEVTQTRGRDTASWNAKAGESGPFWHMSEFRCYDADAFVKNPAYDEVPADVKEALLASIKNGEVLLAEKKATEEAIKAIEDNLKKFWEAYPDASGLKNDLENAAAMADFATEKEEPTMGFYPKGATEALLTVVNKIEKEIEAIESANKSLSLAQIKGYTEQLDAAVADFSAKLVKPEAGKIYLIVSKSIVANQDAPQVSGCVAAVDADLKNGSPVFRYKQGIDDLSKRLNAFWLAVKTEKGLAFKNLANGLYMNNVFEGLTKEEIDSLELPNNQIGYSETPKTFTLESFSNEDYADQGYFVMALMKGQYLNFQEHGKVMVHYSDRNDANAPLTFIEAASEVDFGGSYQLDVEADKVQILSYPVAFDGIYDANGDNGAYEVVGRNGDYIMLQPIEEGIPAGTPFVTSTKVEEGEEAQTLIEGLLTEATSLEDALKLNYNYEPVIKGGLVSAPQSVVLGEGFGVIVNNMVIPSKEGTKVAAGKGFFNKEIQTTEESTDFMIPVDGVISGEGDATAVENVVIVKNVPADVYTLSGVKIRHNVKMSNATEGLPKGIYIVGGKKVVVK